MIRSTVLSGAADAIRKAFPMPKTLQRLRRLALWDLHYGPVRRAELDATDRRVWRGFSAAVDSFRQWCDDSLPSTVFYDAAIGIVSDKEPEPFIDDETGETIEPYTEETYRLESRDVLKALFGELAEYL
jgi:hypothetical protein